MSYGANLKKVGISYLGGVFASAKEKKSYKHGTLTYMIYLAPSDMSGYKVCPNDKYCKDLCLNGSGQNKCDILSRGAEKSKTNKSRIKKTKLFYENRNLFMELLIHEIKKYQTKANKENLDFAVRLNGTSDLSPEIFTYKGKNILEIFPNIQFYDYTKVPNRINLLNKYPNYDLTLSYNGYNWNTCNKFLQNGGKVAVVFENGIPKIFKGYKVIDANNYDMRYQDKPSEICGLTFHRVASQYKNGNYIGLGDTKFVVRETDKNCIW